MYADKLSLSSWTNERNKISSFFPTKRATKFGEIYLSSFNFKQKLNF